MNDVELICFKMISALGAARSSFIEAMKVSRLGQFEQAQRLITEGENYRIQGHDVHFELLQKDSEKHLDKLPLLLIHAEDQLMSVEVLQIMAEELLATHQKFA